MRVRNILIGSALAVALAGGAGALSKPEPVRLDNPQAIEWEKPRTDAEWAEDVKKENFDIRSTGVLKTMTESHTEKLAKQEKAFALYEEMLKRGEDPVQFLYWQKYEELKASYPDMDERELDAEAELAASTAYNQMLWEIEKLKQSVERISKEIELRDKGFVVVEGEKKQGLLGGSVPPERVRHIND